MNETVVHHSPPDTERWGSTVAIQDVMDGVLRAGTDESYCLLNIGLLRERLGLFREHFLPDDPERRIGYAMKANPHERIMTTLAEEGIDGFDCASANEIKLALSIDGIGPEKIFFNNTVKRGTEVREAYALGIRYFTAQSRSGVEKVLGPNRPPSADDVEVAVRLETFNTDAKINLSEKYGCPPEEGLELLRRIKRAGARAALAIHIGSQNTNPGSHIKGIELMREVARQAGGVSSLNVGGGIPVNCLPTDHFDAKGYLEEITLAAQEARTVIFRGDRNEPRIIIEPGRSLVAQAVDLVIPILEIDHHRGKKRIFINDGVLTSFSDFTIHGWEYYFDLFTRDGRKPSDKLDSYTVYGRTCDSGDILGEYLFPSDVQEGDFLWAKNAGAYMDSQASRFNGFGLPQYIPYNVNHLIA